MFVAISVHIGLRDMNNISCGFTIDLVKESVK